MFRSAAGHSWLAALVCLAGGCGAELSTRAVSGTVTLDDKPVEQGEIAFFPVDGTPGRETGGVVERGAYHVPAEKGPRAGGVYRVEITSMVKSGRTIPNPINPQGAPGELYANDIPAIYNAFSTLKVTIDEKGENKHDFALTTQPSAGSR